MTVLVAGTEDRVWVYDDGAEQRRGEPGHQVGALAAWNGGWVYVVGGRDVWTDDTRAAKVPDASPDVTSLAVTQSAALLGTREAHLLRLSGQTVEPVESFDHAEGRDGWYTPWGGPPDTRSLSAAPDGTIYVNVHVGGILRSDDGGESWRPTIDVDADVHEVLAVDGSRVVAATAYGLATSTDRGATWSMVTEGLHGDYSRAVAVAGDWLLMTSSTGPFTDRAALYRRPLDASEGTPFERCGDGVPEWFSTNVDTGRLAARGTTAALAGPDGTVYLSEDSGATWRPIATGVSGVSRLAVLDSAG